MPKLNIDKRNDNKNYKENAKSINVTFCEIFKVSSLSRIHGIKANNPQ